jgi:hypothetical protein
MPPKICTAASVIRPSVSDAYSFAPRHLVEALHLVLVRVELGLHERADGVGDEPLLGRELGVHLGVPGISITRPT